jgi:hypothetical protein
MAARAKVGVIRRQNGKHFHYAAKVGYKFAGDYLL